MLIRWAMDRELAECGLTASACGPYGALAAVDRMTNTCLGVLVFSRARGEIIATRVFDTLREGIIRAALTRCADRQLNPQTGSFHHRYPEYAGKTIPTHCPACLSARTPPEHMINIAELEHSWVVAEEKAQGRLWGKCVVAAKYHSVHFYDLPGTEMTAYMLEVQRTARALHEVSGAVRINFEIHMNSMPHLHCHLFPRYLDDDFPGAPIDYRITGPVPYESRSEFDWFVGRMREKLPS